MPDRSRAFARLPPEERARLEAFIARLDRLSLEGMLMLAARPLDPHAHRAAQGRAEGAAGESLRSEAVEAVRSDAHDWVMALFNRSTVQPGWYEANWGRPGTAGDRANLAIALGDAFTAIVLWDRLDEPDRGELLGPMGSLLDEDDLHSTP
ncbi:MAG TPA: hypothetical protein VEY67_10295 [Candidatus Dormibacteraeota bacterium]|nr:hypothetical protein [Candidatus Dormibacteraeota bacterium]